jgi:acyl-CoA dehydrogenase
MSWEALRSPASLLQTASTPEPSLAEVLRGWEQWWRAHGSAISEATDRAGTPWLRMFDSSGKRVDELLFAPEYWHMLQQGYRTGVLWRAFAQKSLLPAYQLLYVTSFFDPGLACPYTVSLATAVAVSKYASEVLRRQVLPRMLARDETVWQGATWMTEIKGGSDLGTAVETVARPAGDQWLLTGDKYFASNVGAEVAVVAARPEREPRDTMPSVRDLALFLVPKYRRNGELNYFIRRLKHKAATRSVPTGEVELRDSEGYLLGTADSGVYLILEVLNISRVANSIGAVALAQRALCDALAYAEKRIAFGRRILDHPLLKQQFEQRFCGLHSAFALAWESVRLLDALWQERPPYSERYPLFRLLAHLAKFWTAEFAVQTAKWAMEVHGGLGVLPEFGAERWLREAMVLAIWEGTSHRHMLDGLEAMERQQAHRLLLSHLGADSPAARQMADRIEAHLVLPPPEREARIEPLFHDLAAFTAEALLVKSR